MNSSVKLCVISLLSTMLAFSGLAQAAQPGASGPSGALDADKLRQKSSRVTEKAVESSTQQSNLQKDLEDLVRQRQSVEDRERQMAAAIAEHEKALAEQGRLLEEVERELADNKRAYQDQRRHVEEVRNQLVPKKEPPPGAAR